MSAKTFLRAGLAASMATLSLGLTTAPAHAQSAAQFNQLTQAIQACDAMGPLAPPECANIRGKALGALGGMGGKAGQAAGIAGALMGALGNRNAAAAATQAPVGNGMALQAQYAACIQAAGLNTVALQACASTLQAQTATTGLGSVDRNTASAMATYGAAGNYQQCVAANPTNWQMCLNQMQAAGNAGLAAAGVTPQQMQQAGIPIQPAAPAAPADPFASVFGGK